MEETVDVGRTHPDEVALQPPVLIDPRLDVGRIAVPERAGRLRQMREMKAEGRLRRDADAAARDMSQQHGAGRPAWPNDPDTRAVMGVRGPARVVIGDATAVIVGEVDGFRLPRQRTNAEQGDKDEAAWFHRLLPARVPID